ncbi:MAG TPA: L-2-hydroxyglutarate oxidase, partial [Cytophagales bacterium]|nr:L-2-hydroxyglutarate oxidase [Cytophagales bacterium]
MRYDIAIVGGGIVGLATALKIKQQVPKHTVVVLEKESAVAAHQTGHNSGVIHSGIYYKPGSLKARNCIEGYRQLIEFCDQEQIHYELCGKVIVATQESELQALDNIMERGHANGLTDLKMLPEEELKEIEPHVAGIRGIRVPQTGIIDYKGVAKAYAKRFQKLGGEIRLGTKVLNIKERTGYSVVKTDHNDLEANLVVNCAGLYSDKIARLTEKKLGLKIVPFRGEYYKLKEDRKHLVKHLIYPVPDPNFPFLGVHFTRMVDGAVEAGPNAVLAYAREGYTKRKVNLLELSESLAWPGFQKVAAKYWRTGMGELHRSYSKAAFTKALQRLIPEIEMDDLTPGGAGVRAQACDRKGGLLDDFLILENDHAVNVCNAPSPAATSSLSI